MYLSHREDRVRISSLYIVIYCIFGFDRLLQPWQQKFAAVSMHVESLERLLCSYILHVLLSLECVNRLHMFGLLHLISEHLSIASLLVPGEGLLGDIGGMLVCLLAWKREG